MTKEYEQRATRNERERVVSQSPPAPASPTATPVYVYLHAAPRISHITACKKELRKLWRSGPRATTPQSGSGACKLATGAAAHAPLGLVVVWPLGPMDPRESRWATADEAGDLIRRAGCRSPKDEGRLLPAALRGANRLPELYCELGRGRVLATSRPRRALPPPPQRAGPHGAQAMSCGGGR